MVLTFFNQDQGHKTRLQVTTFGTTSKGAHKVKVVEIGDQDGGCRLTVGGSHHCYGWVDLTISTKVHSYVIRNTRETRWYGDLPSRSNITVA